MKYLVLIPDGMADEKIEALGNKTPMEAADKPTTDMLAARATVGTVSNVPNGMVPESDTANMAILSFDPKVYSKGRSPLEAMSMGLTMEPDHVAYRCNIVTLSDEGEYDEKIMLDHSADEITTAEADELIGALDAALGNDILRFYTGVSYRHCILWHGGNDKYNFMRPHDILGQCIKEHLPHGEDGKVFYDLMRKSWDILNNHPVNEARRARGLRPANSIWLWSPGKKPALPSFKEKWGERELKDYWRFSNTISSLMDNSNGMDSTMTDSIEVGEEYAMSDSTMVDGNTETETANDSLSTDPTTREYYIQQIPTTDEEKAAAHKALSDALFEAGVRFKDDVSDKRLTLSYLERVVNEYPEFERLADTYYQLFLACSRWEESEKAEHYKNLLIAGYPDSTITRRIQEPDFFESAATRKHKEDSIYVKAYAHYTK